eukprot:6482187-Amphidinium_carterae.1
MQMPFWGEGDSGTDERERSNTFPLRFEAAISPCVCVAWGQQALLWHLSSKVALPTASPPRLKLSCCSTCDDVLALDVIETTAALWHKSTTMVDSSELNGYSSEAVSWTVIRRAANHNKKLAKRHCVASYLALHEVVADICGRLCPVNATPGSAKSRCITASREVEKAAALNHAS